MRNRSPQLLALIVGLLLWIPGTAHPAAVDYFDTPAETQTGFGLHTTRFRTAAGEVQVHLPSDLAAGDTPELAAGETFELTATIPGWRLSDEFPPDVVLQIDYDPDIFIDGMETNDDYELGNNRAVLASDEINALLSR